MDVSDELEKAAGASPPRSVKVSDPFADRQEESAWAAEMAHIKKRERADERDKLLVPSESRRENDVPSFGERFWKTASGGTKSSASAHTNNAGNALYGEAARQRQQTSGEISAWQDTIDAYQDVLNDPLASASERDTAYNVIGDLGRRIDAYQSAYGSGGANERAAEKLWDAADRTADSAAADIARAKQGGGKATNFLVDAGVSGTQIAGDALLSPIPGASIVPMAARVMGSSSQEARRSGASFEDAMAYGGANALTEVATEKMFDGLAGVYGKGAADEIVDDVIRRASKNPNVQKALNVAASSAGESVEEVVSGALEPALKTIYNGKSAGENYSELEAGDLLYGALLGAALGGVGGAVENARDSGNSLLQPEKIGSKLYDESSIRYISEGERPDFQEFDRQAWKERKQQAAVDYAVSDDESTFLDFYVAGSAYEMAWLQRNIPQNKWSEYEKTNIASVESALRKFPTFKGRTYRNLEFGRPGETADAYEKFLSEYQEGKTVTLKAFSSASKSPNGYPTFGQAVHLVIDGIDACDISDSFGIPTQQEVIFLPGTKLKIERVTVANDGKPLIFAKEELINDMGRSLEVYGSTKNEGFLKGTRDDIRGIHKNGRVEGGLSKGGGISLYQPGTISSVRGRNDPTPYADALRELQQRSAQQDSPYSDELRKLMDEFGGFREP